MINNQLEYHKEVKNKSLLQKSHIKLRRIQISIALSKLDLVQKHTDQMDLKATRLEEN